MPIFFFHWSSCKNWCNLCRMMMRIWAICTMLIFTSWSPASYLTHLPETRLLDIFVHCKVNLVCINLFYSCICIILFYPFISIFLFQHPCRSKNQRRGLWACLVLTAWLDHMILRMIVTKLYKSLKLVLYHLSLSWSLWAEFIRLLWTKTCFNFSLVWVI